MSFVKVERVKKVGEREPGRCDKRLVRSSYGSDKCKFRFRNEFKRETVQKKGYFRWVCLVR